jgi:integrase
MITREALARLAVGQKITAAGIEVERMPNGDLRYWIAARVDNQRLHRVVGYGRQGMTPRKATLVLEQLRVASREGRLGLPAGRKAAMTVAEAARLYIERLEAGEGGARNIAQKKSQLANHILRLLGDQPLAGLALPALQRYRKRRTDEGASPATVNRELAVLSHLIRRACEWGWLAKPPCQVPLVREQEHRMVVLDEAQQAALMAAAIVDAHPLIYLFIAIAMGSGMRHGEIVRIRYSDIDWDRHRLFIGRAKAGPRSQPLTPEVVALLRRERAQADDPDGYIFPSIASRAGHQMRMHIAFERVVRSAGLDPRLVTPHTLRRTAITQLVMAGVDLPTIMRISGHKHTKVLMRYVHLFGSHVDRAVAILGRPALASVTKTSPEVPAATLEITPEMLHVIAFPKKKA